MADLEHIREVVLEILKPYGVKRVAVFGSVVRDEETPESDIDLLVAFERPLGLFTLAHLQRTLSEKLGRKLGLVTEGALGRYIQPFVEEEMEKEEGALFDLFCVEEDAILEDVQNVDYLTARIKRIQKLLETL